jgi:UDP-3-O-[3-hydroxymyristoyl] glucosamine N-acyltransferase
VLWDDVVVEQGAVLEGVVSDKRAVFAAGAAVGTGDAMPANEELPQSLACGASVIGMEVHVPPGARIGKNVIVHCGAAAGELTAPVAAGKSIRGTCTQAQAQAQGAQP